jgi:cell division protein FtsN
MARDYKHRATSRKRRKAVSPWLGVTVGLLVGLFVAFLVYIKMLAPKSPGEISATTTVAPPATPEEVRQGNDMQTPQPPKPRFVFYSELPEMEVIVPEEEIRASVAQPPPVVPKQPESTRQPESTSPPEGNAKQAAPVSTRPAPPAETYYLQAGSFRGADQADRFKAKLALMGFETDIQTITINNKDTYHRVRVGPYSDLRTLDKARSRLKKEGIETRTVKIKG